TGNDCDSGVVSLLPGLGLSQSSPAPRPHGPLPRHELAAPGRVAKPPNSLGLGRFVIPPAWIERRRSPPMQSKRRSLSATMFHISPVVERPLRPLTHRLKIQCNTSHV